MAAVEGIYRHFDIELTDAARVDVRGRRDRASKVRERRSTPMRWPPSA